MKLYKLGEDEVDHDPEFITGYKGNFHEGKKSGHGTQIYHGKYTQGKDEDS